MIVNRRTGLVHLVRRGVPILAGLFAWDIAVVLAFQLAHRSWMDQPALPYSLVGSALVLFLNMRNSAAYNRWWEARCLWGAIINNTRSFARQVESLLGGAPELTKAMIAYAHALRVALRPEPTNDTERLLGPTVAAVIATYRNRPNGILLEIGRGVRLLADQQKIHPATIAAVDRILSDIANAQGGLERIRNTPLAIQFSVLPRVLVQIFCVLLPLSMVQELGWLTPFGSTLAGFLFLALDEIGTDLESPFEAGSDSLPMLAMSFTIEADLLQSIGEAPPDPVGPVDGILQ